MIFLIKLLLSHPNLTSGLTVMVANLPLEQAGFVIRKGRFCGKSEP